MRTGALHARVPRDGPPVLTAMNGPAVDRLLHGKRVESVPDLLGLVFNLCANTHGAAARAALGLPQLPYAGTAMAAEALREHLTVLLRTLPALLEPDAAPALPRGLFAMGGPDPDAAEAALFGPDGAAAAIADLRAWATAGRVPAARAVRLLSDRRPAETALVPQPGASVFDRVADDPSLACFRRRDAGGAPDAAHWAAARLVDAAHRIAALRGDGAVPRATVLGDGIATAPAARGTLTHRASRTDGIVTGYTVETPTDRMAQPGGMFDRIAARAATAPAGPVREARLRLLICVVDPCVPVHVETAETTYA